MRSFKTYLNEYNQEANQPMVIPPESSPIPLPKGRNVVPSQMPPYWNWPWFNINFPQQIPGRRGWRPPGEIQGFPAPYPNRFFSKDPRSPALA